MNDLLEFIGTRSNSEAENVAGGLYEIKDNIFVPNTYNNPLSMLNEKCVIWVRANEESYNVYNLKRPTTEEELIVFLPSMNE